MSRFRVKTEALAPKKKGPAPKLFQNERCRICAESAEGVNYNAISCMACKAFYRRVVVAGKELRHVFSQRGHFESTESIDRPLHYRSLDRVLLLIGITYLKTFQVAFLR